jgi:hypothetical protein
LTKNIVVKRNTRPDIRYPALTGYPAFGLAGCPAKTVSDASLLNTARYIFEMIIFLYFITGPRPLILMKVYVLVTDSA